MKMIHIPLINKIRTKCIRALLLCAFILFAQLAFGEEDDHAPVEKVVTDVPVQVGKIMRATLRSYVSGYGTVEPEPAGKNHPPASARIASPVTGVVSETKCYEGQRVKKGDVLFKIDGRTADIAVQTAEKIVDRQKKLLAVGGTSQKALQEAEQQLAAARMQRALLEIRAPLTGTVVRVNSQPGEAVDATSVIAEIIDLNHLSVFANLPSAEIASLKVGAPTKFSSGSQSATGQLIYIGSSVDPKIGSVVVRASLSADSGFLVGQFADLKIVSAEHKSVLAAPIESVTKNKEGQTVLAIIQGDRAIQKPVKTGLRDGNLIEVEGADLKEGTQIVTVGSYGLPAETKVHVSGD